MKAFVVAILAAGVITLGANIVLNSAGFSAQEATTVGHSVRVGDGG